MKMLQQHTWTEARSAVHLAKKLGFNIELLDEPSEYLAHRSNHIELTRQMTPSEVCHKVNQKLVGKGQSLYQEMFDKIETIIES